MVCKEVDQGVVEDRINAKRVVDEVLSGDVEDGVGVVEVMENGDVMSSTMLVGSTNVKLPKKRLNDDVVEEMQVREQLINVKGVVEENVFVDLAKEKEIIEKESKLIVGADKTSNFYKVDPNQYKDMVKKNVEAEYKKETVANVPKVNKAHTKNSE